MTMIPNSSDSGFAWTKSTYSGGDNNCVEVAFGAIDAALPVRDSKLSDGPAVVMGDTAWGVFVDAVRRGDVA